MNAVPRVAFFSDSFHEVNGVALTSRQLEAFARRRGLPFFSAHAGSETHLQRDGTAMIYDLQRSGASLSLEADSDLSFDMLLFRYRAEVMDALREFKPDLIHVTGPGDLGLLGAWVAHELKIPLAASWHTNVHEYAGRRLEKLLAFLPEAARNAMGQAAERGALSSTAVFYKLARVLFAPNQELVDLLRNLTGSPCFLMQRGVDAQMYSPEKRPSECATQPFTIGYVGRLSVEKNVRLLVDVEKAILAAGHTDYRFLVIGPGGEDAYLREHMQRLELPGVLRGEDLARAYASMDVFAFPSETETFGNVILEALASGVPPVVTSGGGPKFLVKSGETGFVAKDDAAFSRSIIRLMEDRELHRTMREAARAQACAISWDRVFEKVYEAYDEVLFTPGDRRAAS